MRSASTSIPDPFVSLLEHSTWVRWLAWSLVRDDALADDLAQETWLVALKHPPEAGLPVRPWLAQVVRNLVRMKARGERRRRQREDTSHKEAQVEEAADSPAQLVEQVETQRMLAGLVVDLEEPFRSTVLLRYHQGLSAADIAARQQVPAGTVRWRLKTGLDRLRAALDRQQGGDRSAWQRALAPLGVAPMGRKGAGGTPAAANTKGALIMKPFIAAAVIFTGGALGTGIVAHQRAAAPKAPPAAVTITARAADPQAAPTAPRLDKEQRAQLLQRITQARPQPAAAPAGNHAAGSVPPAPLLDQDYIRAQIQTIMPLVKECYDNALTAKPELQGKLVVDFTIIGAPDIGGLVENSTINAAQSTIADPGMRECVQETMYAAQFPAPPNDGEVKVSLPFIFRPVD